MIIYFFFYNGTHISWCNYLNLSLSDRKGSSEAESNPTELGLTKEEEEAAFGFVNKTLYFTPLDIMIMSLAGCWPS